MTSTNKLSVTQAAKIIGCGPRHVRWMISSGYIKRAEMIGSFMYVIPQEEVLKARDRRQAKRGGR